MFLLEYCFMNLHPNTILKTIHSDLESLRSNGLEALKFVSYL